MKLIFEKSFKDLFQPKIIILVLIPWFLTFGLSLTLGFFTFEFIYKLISNPEQFFSSNLFFSQDIFWISTLKDLIINLIGALTGIFIGFSLFSLWPLIFTFMTGILSPFVTPIIMRWIAPQYAPYGEKKGNHSWFYFGTKGLYYLCVYLLFCIFTSPLFLIPIIGNFWSFLINAIYLTKVFSLDTVDDYADHGTETPLLKQSSFYKTIWVMGFLHSFLLTLPFYAIVAPVFISLTFGHWTLISLAKIRSTMDKRVIE